MAGVGDPSQRDVLGSEQCVWSSGLEHHSRKQAYSAVLGKTR